MQIEEGISVLFRNTKMRLKDYSERLDPELQPAGYTILRYVMSREPIRAADIATALGMDKSAVSRQLTSLREIGLLETHPDPADGRATLLASSEKARTALASFQASFRSAYREVLSTWDDSDVDNFARLLRKFNDGIL